MLFVLFSLSVSLISFEVTECQTVITYKGTGVLTSNDAENAKGKKKIIISQGITEIQSYAFSQTSFQSSALNSFIYEEIELPCSLVTIGDYAFQNYYSELRKIHFPNYPYGSYSESNLENYYSLRNIGQYIFNQNYKILCHNIPPTFTTASSFAFACCSIRHIGLNSKITEINSYTFQHCTSLQSIVIPCIVRSIYKGAFYNCQQLKSITFENNVEITLYSEIFYNCTNLRQIIFPPNTEFSSSNDIFYNCISLSSVTMPTTLRGIFKVPNSMFKNCINLRYCTFPTNLAEIPEYMFYNTSIEKVYLTGPVTYIYDYAFSNCYNLKYAEIIVPSNENYVYFNNNAFYNTPNIELMIVRGRSKLYLYSNSLSGSTFCLLDPYTKYNYKNQYIKAFQYPTVVYSTEEYKNQQKIFAYQKVNPITNGVCSLPIQTPFPVQSEDRYDSFPWDSDCFNYPGPSSCGGNGGWTDPYFQKNHFSNHQLFSYSSKSSSYFYSYSNRYRNNYDNPTATPNPSNDDKKENNEKKKGLSGGAIAGIVIGCIAFFVINIVCYCICTRKQKIVASPE